MMYLRKGLMDGLMMIGLLVLTNGLAYADLPTGVSLSQLTTIASNNDNKRRPVSIVNAGDGSDRLFIVLQNGEILIYDLDTNTLLSDAFLDIRSAVDDEYNEQGLLGLAFHPDYANNGYFYVNYIQDKGLANGQDDHTIIARYTVSANDADQADAASEQVLLEVNQDSRNHNGGHMQFGPEGYLYIGMGDGGGSGDPNRHAQDMASLLGKMLRIDVDASPPPTPNNLCGLNAAGYGIPAGNIVNFILRDTFEDDSVTLPQTICPEIWALGLRNPWRWSFDRLTGDLFIGDVGQDAMEEIDFQAAGQVGLNYGWRCREGDQAYQSAQNDPACINTPPIPFTEPVLTYGRSQGYSVTGGYRYRGASAAMQGVYIYGDYGGRLFFAAQSGGGWSNTHFDDTSLAISAFGEDEGGELYIANINGSIYRIVMP